MEPGDNDALKKVNLLIADGTNYDLIVKGGDKNILISPLGADPKIVGGPGKWGDYDPSFGNIAMSDWSRGWGTKDLADNPNGFNFSRNVWTATRNKLFLTPRAEQIDLQVGVHSLINWTSYGCGDGTQDTDRILNTTNTAWAQSVTTVNAMNVARVTFWGKWNKVSDSSLILRVNIYADGGSPGRPSGASLGATAYLTITEFEDVYQELNFFFSAPIALSAATKYWFEITATSMTDGGLQLQSGPSTLYGTSCYYTAGAYVTGADPLSIAVVHNNVNRRKIKLFQFGGAQFAYGITKAGVVSLYLMGEAGFATSATSTTLVDTNMGLRGAWTTDQFLSHYIKIVAGTGAGQIRYINGNDTAGSISLLSNDAWDITPDATSRYVIIAPNDWVLIASGTHGLSNVQSVADAGEVCYFACGNSTNIRRMAWNNSAAPLQFADDGTNKASVLFSVAGRVWAANSATGVISYSAIKTWGTNLAFTALATKTPIDVDFKGAGINAGKVYFIKENGVWFCDAASDILYEFPVDMRYFIQSTNGEAVISNQEYLYFNFGASMLRLSGLAMETTDYNRDNGVPDEYKGFISGLAPHPAGVFFAINAGRNGISSVNVFDGLAFHNVFSIGAKGVPFTDIMFYPVEDQKPILFIAGPDTIYYQKYPENHLSPLEDTTMEFFTQGDIELPIYDMGSKSMDKLFKNLALWGQDWQVPTSDYYYKKVIVFYNADNAGWVKLGETSDQEYGEKEFTFTDPANANIAGLGNVKELKLKIFLLSHKGIPMITTPFWAEDFSTPVVDAITTKVFGRTRIRNVYSFPIDISAVTERLGSGNPDTMFAHFQSWAQDTTTIYMTSQHPQLHQKTVIIIPRSMRTTYIDRSNETFAADFYLELREI